MPLDVHWVRSFFPRRDIRWATTATSTMVSATSLAQAGCPSGTIVGADEQLNGQGRYGRHWNSQAGVGLYVSEVLRLPIPADSLPVVTLALGLAVSDAILRTTDVACDLRWPNDVMLRKKKCAGILVQLHEQAIVAGIGINVNQTEFPEELQGTATSIRMVTGKEHCREKLLVALIESVDSFTDMLVHQGKEAILRAFEAGSSFVRGRRVIVDQGGERIEGTTEGLDRAGFLVLREVGGKRTVVLAGGVRAAP
ncbi:MAG TPA: biotin--[acetyl-CoA-carboxylase] ligase [Bryobacteraceae bacterium]|nr:biotin--[acetyl-CoA-carboxylase] ligase [Bryobacteraceae bacterium]